MRSELLSSLFSSTASTSTVPCKVAIVGSGPSGCYTAKYIQSSFQKKYLIRPKIDIFERLPVPYGLVRYGVAPDHPEVKNVQNDFDTLFHSSSTLVDTTNGSNKNNDIQFYGNVHVGGNRRGSGSTTTSNSVGSNLEESAPDAFDVSILELRKLYDIVVLAYGCESDRKLGIPGEELGGVLSAREFVAWYNGHPEYVHIGEKVAKALGYEYMPDDENLTSSRNLAIRDVPVVVIGQGNVALDCARILAKGSAVGLYETDIASHTIPVLGDGISNISIVGRRGHVQGAFTIKELRELVKLESEGYQTSFIVRQDELDMGSTDASKMELDGTNGRPKIRIETLLRETAAKVPNQLLPKQINLRFLLNPIKILPSSCDSTNNNNSQSVGYVVCERTRLRGDAGNQIAEGTGEFETLPARLVLVSIGYKALQVPGTEQWFDNIRGTLKNVHGRVHGVTQELGGLYVSGWLKRGPSGIIGTNIADAKDTVATIVKDIDDGTFEKLQRAEDDDATIESILNGRGVQFVNWDGVKKIEEQEQLIRRSTNQPREKLTEISEMLQLVGYN